MLIVEDDRAVAEQSLVTGAVAVVVDVTVKRAAAAAVPKSTAVAPVRRVSVTVTEVPPAVGPENGTSIVTVGGATRGKTPQPPSNAKTLPSDPTSSS